MRRALLALTVTVLAVPTAAEAEDGVLAKVRRAMGLAPPGPVMLLPAPSAAAFSERASVAAPPRPSARPVGAPTRPAALKPRAPAAVRVAAPTPLRRPEGPLARPVTLPARTGVLANSADAAPPPTVPRPAAPARALRETAQNTVLTGSTPPVGETVDEARAIAAVDLPQTPAAPVEAPAPAPSAAPLEAASGDAQTPAAPPLEPQSEPGVAAEPGVRPAAAEPQNEPAPPVRAAEAPAAEPQRPVRPRTGLRQLTRTLSALQDDIARGAGAAVDAQVVLARRIADELAAMSPEERSTRDNARALLFFALSGGSPTVVRAALDGAEPPAPLDAFLRGALAYVEGRQADALRHFAGLDLRDLPHVARGPAYLALAALTVEDDAVRALAFLDDARHAAPGTLIEEAALRRSVLLTAELNDTARFKDAVERYLRKFRTSVYAGNFRRRLGGALTRMAFLDDAEAFQKLEDILGVMPADGQREIYLDLARTAVESGRPEVGAKAAERAAALAEGDTLDARRASLYSAAAAVVDPARGDDAIVALRDLGEAALPETDDALRLAALRLGETVADLPQPLPPRRLLDTDIPEALGALGVPEGADALLPPPEPLEIEARVNAALATIDTILEGAQ
ncbi:MAG: hypothetical protein AAF318_11850 [Pseudomonadota bacterium]